MRPSAVIEFLVVLLLTNTQKKPFLTKINLPAQVTTRVEIIPAIIALFVVEKPLVPRVSPAGEEILGTFRSICGY
jgi:hypothetical protein